MPSATDFRRLASIALGGLAVFIAGVVIATRTLPEWRARHIPSPSHFDRLSTDLAQAAGVRSERTAGIALRTRSWASEGSELRSSDFAFEYLGSGATDWIAQQGRLPVVEVRSRSRWNPGAPEGELQMLFATTGTPIGVRWLSDNPFQQVRSGAGDRPPSERMAAILLPSGAVPHLEKFEVFGQSLALAPVPHTDPAETIVLTEVTGATLPQASRVAGTPEWVRSRLQRVTIGELIRREGPFLLLKGTLAAGTLLLFIVLLVKRRIALKSGAVLGLISLVTSAGGIAGSTAGWIHLIDASIGVVFKSLALFVLWSSAESWVRSTVPGFRTSLDSLRSGRLGPKGGRALLAGWGLGAGIAGLTLALASAATRIPGIAVTDATVRLPLFGGAPSAIDEGVIRAGIIVLAIVAGIQLPLIKRVPLASTVIGGIFLASRTHYSAFWLAAAIGIVVAALLIRTYRILGLTAVVSAAITSTVLPAAVYAASHFEWLAAPAAFLAVFALAPAILGVVGLRRSSSVEDGQIRVPAFVRRLEEENRVRYEMNLLAQMQIGLLPKETPVVDGYEFAAKSVLATEAGGDLYDFIFDDAGRLWIASGDVAGHGYSCAIAQAMTKAGLASLIDAEKTPAFVLGRLDRVLRRSGSGVFTSLTLLCLDPASGRVVVSNAGHPFPIVARGGAARELELPSLPLGKGPAREYADVTITMEHGSAIVLCSDGLSEAVDARDDQFGFDRLRTRVAAIASRPATGIVDALLAEWRTHIGSGAPLDDTTIVVVKRSAPSA